MSTIEQNYQSVQQRLQQACHDSQRAAHEVRLLAVSKTKPASQVEAIYRLGQRAFGENYVQDGLEKITALTHLADIEWHFIGPLQANKSRPVAEHFHWVETIDRDKIARRLSDQRPATMPDLQVLVQVNISREAQKAGVLPEQTLEFARTVAALPRLQLRGLMCIAEATADQTVLADQFARMRTLYEQLQQEFPRVDTLSMGMSADLELAIACGSTEIRIGSDIFGARDYPAARP